MRAGFSDKLACSVSVSIDPSIKHAENAPDPAGAFVAMNVIDHGTDRWPDALGRGQKGQRLGRRAGRTIGAR